MVQPQLADKIIREQALIIGPIAWEQAEKVTGLRIDIKSHEVNIDGDVRDVLERLVAQYEKLFGNPTSLRLNGAMRDAEHLEKYAETPYDRCYPRFRRMKSHRC